MNSLQVRSGIYVSSRSSWKRTLLVWALWYYVAPIGTFLLLFHRFWKQFVFKDFVAKALFWNEKMHRVCSAVLQSKGNVCNRFSWRSSVQFARSVEISRWRAGIKTLAWDFVQDAKQQLELGKWLWRANMRAIWGENLTLLIDILWWIRIILIDILYLIEYLTLNGLLPIGAPWNWLLCSKGF